MVKKYFQNSNISLNKLLHWNKVSQKWSVVKLGGHSLVQHVCSIENYRLIRPKLTPHVAPIYVPTPIKTWNNLTHYPITCQWMGNSRMLFYEKSWKLFYLGSMLLKIFNSSHCKVTNDFMQKICYVSYSSSIYEEMALEMYIF